MTFTDRPSGASRGPGGDDTRWVEGPTAPDPRHSYTKRLVLILVALVLLVGGFFALERLTQQRERTVVTVESTDGIVLTPSRNIVVRGGDRPPIARAGNIPAGELTVRDGDATHVMRLDVEEYSAIRVGDQLEVCTIRHRLLGFTEIINSPDC